MKIIVDEEAFRRSNKYDYELCVIIKEANPRPSDTAKNAIMFYEIFTVEKTARPFGHIVCEFLELLRLQRYSLYARVSKR